MPAPYKIVSGPIWVLCTNHEGDGLRPYWAFATEEEAVKVRDMLTGPVQKEIFKLNFWEDEQED